MVRAGMMSCRSLALVCRVENIGLGSESFHADTEKIEMQISVLDVRFKRLKHHRCTVQYVHTYNLIQKEFHVWISYYRL